MKKKIIIGLSCMALSAVGVVACGTSTGGDTNSTTVVKIQQQKFLQQLKLKLQQFKMSKDKIIMNVSPVEGLFFNQNGIMLYGICRFF